MRTIFPTAQQHTDATVKRIAIHIWRKGRKKIVQKHVAFVVSKDVYNVMKLFVELGLNLKI